MIYIDNLIKTFDDYIALDQLQLRVKKGSVYGLVGVNGAGKTTIIKHLAGIYRQDYGDVCIDGQPVYDNVALKARVGYIPDDLYFFSHYNVQDMGRFYSGLYKNWNPERFEALLDLLQLDKRRSINKFSKGMQKQAAFALSLSLSPDVLLLDEPIDGLDPVVRKVVFQQLIDDVAAREMTVLISSHNLKEMEGICDAIGIVKAGRMVIERDLDDLKSDVHKIQVVFPPDVSLSQQEMLASLGAGHSDKSRCDGLQVLHVEKRGSIALLVMRGREADVIGHIKNWHPLVYDVLPLTLEEIFVYEMDGDLHAALH